MVRSLVIVLLFFHYVDNCVLPPDAGPCNGSVNRWYFNQSSGQCENFTYGGCQGNGNNFATLSNCLKNCVSGEC